MGMKRPCQVQRASLNSYLVSFYSVPGTSVTKCRAGCLPLREPVLERQVLM